MAVKPTRRSFKTREDTILHGKLPPQACDMEEGILGAIMGWDDNLPEQARVVLMKMKPHHFYRTSCSLICEAILQLHSQGFPMDVLSVTEQLKKNGNLESVNGPLYVTGLAVKVGGNLNIEYWFRIVYQKYLQREMIRISHENMELAYDDTTDCFDLLEKFQNELSKLDHSLVETVFTSSFSLGDEMLKELDVSTEQTSRGIILPNMVYRLEWPRFDDVVTLGRDKMILIAGAASAGKSKFTRCIAYRLLERYPETSICWISLEDSKNDLLRSYVASKSFITAKKLKSKDYPKSMIPSLKEHVNRFKTFDIEFIDTDIKSPEIISSFIQFCDKRKDRFNILIVDNIMSLGDVEEYKHNLNAYYDYVMHNLRKVRQKTKALIIPIHHFNDAQQDKENLRTGYRPVMKDMKGTEAFRRVPNQVLLINSFNIYKDLMAEYSGHQLEVLKHMFVVDTGKNREDKVDDDTALIHFFTEMAYDHFEEIPVPKIDDEPPAPISAHMTYIPMNDIDKSTLF